MFGFLRPVCIRLRRGLLAADGTCALDLTLTPLDGHAELAVAEAPEGDAAWELLLRCCPGLDRPTLERIAEAERGYLFVQIDRLHFGAIRFQTVRCPHEACGEALDIRIDLGTIEPPEASLETTLELRCVECDRPFEYRYEPAACVVGALRSQRAELLQQINVFALHYHWGPDEILALPRQRRLELLDVLTTHLSSLAHPR